MTRYVFLGGVVLALLVIQTTTPGMLIPSAYKPDLVIILVVWASLRFHGPSVVCFAFVAGLAVDALSGSPLGLFAVLYTSVCLVCRRIDAAFDIDGPIVLCLLVAVSASAVGIVALLFRALTNLIDFGAQAAVWILGKSLLTGLASVLMIPIMDFLYARLLRIADAQ